MKWFNNLKIQKKLFVAFGVFILLMIILTVYSASQLRRINSTFENLTISSISRQTYLTDAIITMYDLHLNNISTFNLINSNENFIPAARLDHNEYEELCTAFLKNLEDYRSNSIEDSSLAEDMLHDRLNIIREIEGLFTGKYISLFYKIQEGINTDNNIQATGSLHEENDIAGIIIDKLNFLHKNGFSRIEKESYSISSSSRLIVYTEYIVAIGIIIFSILVSLFMTKRLVLPIYKLEIAAMEIIGGNLEFPIRNDNNDELGDLSNHMGDMVDALKKANEAKSAFLANISHEIRSSLNIIVGLTDLRMEDIDLSDNVKTDIIKINSAGEILLGIVNDVLDISKIEAGKFELTPVEYNTANLLNDIIQLNTIRIFSKPIIFNVDINENLPSELFGDELKVKQIFNNLLSNAFKFTNEGKVSLQLDSIENDKYKNDENTIWLSATVKDTGIGIHPEDIAKLFSDYNQVDTKTNRNIEGSGLGLSIVKKLLSMMDGEITVESEYGKGSTFRVIFRQKIVNNKIIGPNVAEKLKNFSYLDEKRYKSKRLIRPDLSGIRVLVVDDYPANLDITVGLLQKYKIQADCTDNGQSAVDIIKNGEPFYHAVFMDHMMPVMDGVEATQLIRNLDSEYAKSIPIIALTANVLAGNEKLFLENGFNSFLSKPINILQLDYIIKNFIIKKSQDFSSLPETDTTQDNIHGINMEVFGKFFNNEIDIYTLALKSFAVHMPESINKIRKVTAESLNDYSIIVHSLKSTSANIGAEEISEKAKKLELMSKAGDLNGVLAENDEFIKDMETLLQNINNWLKKKKLAA